MVDYRKELVMKIKPNRGPGRGLVEPGPRQQKLLGGETELHSAASPALQIKRILVPIDFSACSNKALQYAVPIAERFGGRLCLVYVGQGYYFAPELGAVDLTAVESGARADAAGKLAALASEKIGKKIPVDIFVRDGPPAAEITRLAKEYGADLIVISTHGYTGLKHAWFGSVTEDVVRHGPCPILVVREQEHEFLS
jgi:nucleotide-binding universal stress UspA family protein